MEKDYPKVSQKGQTDKEDNPMGGLVQLWRVSKEMTFEELRHDAVNSEVRYCGLFIPLSSPFSSIQVESILVQVLVFHLSLSFLCESLSTVWCGHFGPKSDQVG